MINEKRTDDPFFNGFIVIFFVYCIIILVVMLCFLIEVWIDCVDFLMDAIGLIGLICAVYLALLVYAFILFQPQKISAGVS